MFYMDHQNTHTARTATHLTRPREDAQIQPYETTDDEAAPLSWERGDSIGPASSDRLPGSKCRRVQPPPFARRTCLPESTAAGRICRRRRSTPRTPPRPETSHAQEAATDLGSTPEVRLESTLVDIPGATARRDVAAHSYPAPNAAVPDVDIPADGGAR